VISIQGQAFCSQLVQPIDALQKLPQNINPNLVNVMEKSQWVVILRRYLW